MLFLLPQLLFIWHDTTILLNKHFDFETNSKDLGAARSKYAEKCREKYKSKLVEISIAKTSVKILKEQLLWIE